MIFFHGTMLQVSDLNDWLTDLANFIPLQSPLNYNYQSLLSFPRWTCFSQLKIIKVIFTFFKLLPQPCFSTSVLAFLLTFTSFHKHIPNSNLKGTYKSIFPIIYFNPKLFSLPNSLSSPCPHVLMVCSWGGWAKKTPKMSGVYESI